MLETFQAMIGGRFAPLTIMSNDNTEIDSMITTFNTAVEHILHAFALSTSLLRVLKVTIAAAHKTSVIGESQIEYGPSTDGNGRAAVMECFLYDPL